MLATLLSDGKSSRLQKEVVDKQQKALFAGAFAFPTEDPGLAIMFSIANMGVNVMDLENAVNAEIEKVKNEMISEDELQKIKNQVEADFITRNSSVAGIAETLSNYKVYFGEANLINTEMNRYLKVTREDIKRVANKYFVKENRVVLHYLPKQSN
jgi:predicted Zn-dependent peptidase